ncbi:ribokinase [Serpentinicella alkaliphila]|uniref:Ribokinase n=1 Tax=Serpentinicella alkaliphila TaxID=1734049 RepID=A0A4R2TKD1_9FIRM|nr:ribokinase [Serpentinicella alkaliphila]TCQ03276.1 ribokinase [Serpentinicella alkaliphila]
MSKVTVFGSFVVDLMARVTVTPKSGETVKGSYFKMSAGGKGSNQAVAAKRAGANVVMITKVGQDNFKDIDLTSFEREEISTVFIFIDNEKPTGVALIMVGEEDGQNIITVVPGASDNILLEEVKKAKNEIISGSHLLIQLETNLDVTIEAINIAKENNVKVILNPAPVINLPDAIYEGIYLITPNELEAESLSGVKINDEKSLIKTTNFFHEKGVENVIITLGSKGVYISTKSERVFVEAIEVEVVDTTGAGDAFNVGLVAALASGRK